MSDAGIDISQEGSQVACVDDVVLLGHVQDTPMDMAPKAKRLGRPPKQPDQKLKKATSLSIDPDELVVFKQKAAMDGLSLSGFLVKAARQAVDEDVARSHDVATIRNSGEYRAEIAKLGEKLAQILWVQQDLTAEDQRRLASNVALRFNVPTSIVVEDAMKQARVWLAKWP